MGFLGLCADSARPPGLNNHRQDTNGSHNISGYHFSEQQQDNVTPPFNRASLPCVTAYTYISYNSYPPSNLTPCSLSSLHVISVMTSHFPLTVHPPSGPPFPQCNIQEPWPRQCYVAPTYNRVSTSPVTAITFTPASSPTATHDPPHCNITKATPPHWLPTFPTAAFNNYSTSPTHTSRNELTPTTLQLIGSMHSLCLWLLLCFLMMAAFVPTRPRMERTPTRKRTPRPQRPHYPLQKPPGIRTKYGKLPTAWNIIYDPKTDTILTWCYNRVRIYRRRGQRQFIYQKGKHENTFPRTAQPIHGHWQGSTFIVTHFDHWTNTPTAIPDNHSITERHADPTDWNWPTQTCTNPRQQMKHLDNKTGNPQHTMATLIINRKTITNPTNNFARSQHHTSNNDNPKNGPPRCIKKPPHQQFMVYLCTWHLTELMIVGWTKPHLDAYLALAAVACAWNIEPG
jgi:hypothetical protein